METVGILSIIEKGLYRKIKMLWKVIQDKYSSRAVQSFSHPNITFQGGKTNRYPELEMGFQKLSSSIKPFEIEVEGLGRFDKKVIYLSIKKSNEIVEINRLVNGFLRDYCDELFDDYSPENWIPHVTLAMEDLPERNFETAWNEIRDYAIKFKQTLHNICLVKKHPNGRIGIAKRCGL